MNEPNTGDEPEVRPAPLTIRDHSDELLLTVRAAASRQAKEAWESYQMLNVRIAEINTEIERRANPCAERSNARN